MKHFGGLADARLLFVLFAIAAALGGNACARLSGTPSLEIPIAKAESGDPLYRDAHSMIESRPEAPEGYIRLAGIYIKKARETGDFGLNSKAEAAVDRALELSPDDRTARKLKASLHLTFHRFGDALVAGRQLQSDFRDDPFGYGVLTDANAELGNYDDAVAAAQRMVDLRPNTPSYARVAHLRSLYGDHKGAVQMYRLAARTADPGDKETQSWCLVQLGDEFWKNGKYAEAEKAYDDALGIFPEYHLAVAGKGRVKASVGDLDQAEKYLTSVVSRVPNVDSIILLGDVYTRLGRGEEAARQYELVQTVEERLGVAGDQKRLALFWADRDTRLADALAIAEREYSSRKDIYTADVYAWCLLKNGRPREAKTVIDDAMHLKTGDARILYHAGMIEKNLGNRSRAKHLLEMAFSINPGFDLLEAEKAHAALREFK